MCQLILVDLGRVNRNRSFLHMQMITDSAKANNDGCGFFADTGIIKTSIDAQWVSNFGKLLIENIVSTKPVIGHVRAATNYAGVKTVTDETSHPFETDKLVLAHNGVLTTKESETNKLFPNVKVDSELFLSILDSKYDGKNFVSAFQETLKLFYGTFAFLIYSKLENRYFIIRGKTKKLHKIIVNFKREGNDPYDEIGIVINTDNNDLTKGFIHFKAQYEINYANITANSVGKIEELKEETIFELIPGTATLLEIGSAKEETPPVKTSYYHDARNDNYWMNENANSRDYLKEAKELAEYLKTMAMSLQELDMLVFYTIGKTVLETNTNDLLNFCKEYARLLGPMATKKKQDIWSKLVSMFGNPYDVYFCYTDLKFPYMRNSVKLLNEVYKNATEEIYNEG